MQLHTVKSKQLRFTTQKTKTRQKPMKVFHNQIELTCNGVYLICLSMNFFEEGFLFVRTERPDYTTGMSILNSIHEGDSFSAENL